MPTYEETIAKLESIGDRVKSGLLSDDDKEDIKRLYREICGKAVLNTSCHNCYSDAYIETYLQLRKLGKMPQKPNYSLKPGVVIRKFGSNSFYALSNCPDDVAEAWLREDEKRINLFETFPANWHDRVFSEPTGEVDGGNKGGEDDSVETHAEETLADAEKPADTETPAEENANEAAEQPAQAAGTAKTEKASAKKAKGKK